jgi:hypothetical protein
VPAGLLLEAWRPPTAAACFRRCSPGSAEECEKQTLWAVAGPSLACGIDGTRQSGADSNIALPTQLGPLRSVQPATIRGKQVLLVGAQLGVMAVSRIPRRQPTLYARFKHHIPDGLQSAIVCGERRGAAMVKPAWSRGDRSSC